jgi:hypothetical protein
MAFDCSADDSTVAAAEVIDDVVGGNLERAGASR